MTESEEQLKSLLMRVKEASKKASLKLKIQKVNIMASDPITSWQIEGDKNGNSNRFYFLGFPNHWGPVTAVMKLKVACSSEEKLR